MIERANAPPPPLVGGGHNDGPFSAGCYKMASITLGTNLVRRELGLPERPCKLADPKFSLVPNA